MKLAVTLAPHIDWIIPPPPETKRKNRVLFMYNLLIIPFVGIPFNFSLAQLRLAGDQCKIGGSECWILVWAGVSILIVALALVVRTIALLEYALTIDPALARRRRRLSLYMLAIVIFAGFSGLIALVFQYQIIMSTYNSPNVIMDNFLLIAVSLHIVGVCISVPLVLVMMDSSYLRNSWLARFHDLGFVVFPVVAAWIVWVSRDILPISLLIFVGAIGMVSILGVMSSVRTKKTLFLRSCSTFLSFQDLLSIRNSNANWLAWINYRLPNPEDQMALKKALVEIDPPSTIKSAFDVIIVGAGGWLILTALGAIIEWIIQNWLSSIL